MAREHILVVDDEADILELLQYNLAREGYSVTTTTSGEEALKRAKEKVPHLIVLDLMLPGIDGLEVMKRLKEHDDLTCVPVVMLTAKGEESDVVAGLELGADDYIVKPFSPRILTARIRAVLRRRQQAGDEPPPKLTIHDLEIDTGRRQVMVQGQPVDLTYTEFQVLLYLANRPGWVYTRTQILDAIRGDDYPVTDRSVDVQIVGLRKKLGACGRYIETVRGVGYRFSETP